MRYSVFIIGTFFVLSATQVFADEVYLNNGDRVSGTVIVNTESEVQIESEAAGVVSIKGEFVKNVIIPEVLGEHQAESVENKKEEVVWKKEASIGYNLSRGNTEKSYSLVSIYLNRNTGYDEWTLKGKSFYSSTNKKMDSQKWDGFLRYAFSFGENLKAYNFYQLDADHDRFANIDYRLTPFTGIGYWFLDREDVKWMGEIGVGLEHTSFRDNQEEKDEAILVPRFFSEYALMGDSKLTKDVSLFLPFNDVESYRIRAEVAFINPIDEHLSFKVSAIDDFNSNPGVDIKKNDLQFISALVYSF
ncbi:MAG: DUF481 domain-containing protein [Candidatus Aceula lacicola]|nr:DUF481 domain-containing protein [Candidatus Aceula lacicola]